MNTEFTAFSYEDSEKFMKRSLAYGMFPDISAPMPRPPLL